MANIRAGIAYVDVRLGSVEKLKRDMNEKMEEIGNDAGEKLKESMGSKIGETVTPKVKTKVTEEFKKTGDRSAVGFGSSFAARLSRSGHILRGNLMAWMLPAAVAVGPFIGATLGSLIVAALPIAAMAGGIALIAEHPKIQKTGEKIVEKMRKGLTRRAGVLVEPVLESMKELHRAFKRSLPDIGGMFRVAAQQMVPLATSIGRAVNSITEGMNNAVQKSGPIMEVFNRGIERVGAALGEFFTKITADPEAIEGMADALDDLFGLIVLVIKWFGNFIVSASRAYAQFKDSWGAIKDWFSGTIVPSLKRAGDQFMGIWNAIDDWFHNKIVPSWKRAGSQFMTIWNGVKDWFKGIPKWFADRGREIGNAFRVAWDGVKIIMRTAKAVILSVAKSIPDSIVDFFRRLRDRLFNAGSDAMNGFFRGLARGGAAVIQKARDIAATVANTIRSVLRIGSPSKVMMELGKWTMVGFQKGMDAHAPDITSRLPKSISSNIRWDFGSIQNPQMDLAGGSAALHIDNYIANENVDPWRQAEDWYFLVSARGGIA